MTMATIYDIARLSGYSVATVSRVINHRENVAPDKRKKIQKIMEELDYTPNHVAQDLSHGKSNQIGIVLPYLDHPFFDQIVTGIIEAAYGSGFALTLLPTDYQRSLEREYLERLREKSLNALIFTSRNSGANLIKSFDKYGRIVCCDDTRSEDILCAYSEREASYNLVFSTFKERRYQDIGVLLGRRSNISYTTRTTLDAYREVFDGQRPKEVLYDNYGFYDGYRSGQQMLRKNVKLDAVLGNNDDVAAGFLRAYQDIGEKPPVIVGQENSLSSHLLNFSSIDHQLKKLGRVAFELATGSKNKSELIHYQLVERGLRYEH